jgi:hypothetical protein
VQKVIDVYLEGDLTLLLERWTLPGSILFRQESPNVATALLVDEDVERFAELEAAVAALSGGVRLEATFWAHSFEETECRAAALLALRAPKRHDLVLRAPADGSRRRMSDVPQTPIVETGDGFHLFERPLLGLLARRGLLAGRAAPLLVELDADVPDADQWALMTATFDLGPPLLERRFVRGFRQERTSEVHFATSSAEGLRSLYVSQDVYRLLSGLGAASEGLTFEPVELVGRAACGPPSSCAEPTWPATAG